MNDDQLSELLRRLEHEWAPEVLELAARIAPPAYGWNVDVDVQEVRDES